jgi:hypothetical protein
MDPFVMDLVPDRCMGWGSYGAVWTLRNNDDECIKIMSSSTKPHEEQEILIREIFGATLCRNRSVLLLGKTWATVMRR